MAEQGKIRELDLSNKEDRKYLKNLIKDKIKSERPHQNAYASYKAMKKGAKDYDLVIMSDGTVRNKRVQMNEAISEAGKPKSSITESVAPVKSKDTDDMTKELAKYKVSVTYEEPKAKSEGKPAANQEKKSNPKPESKQNPKPATSTKPAAPSKSTKSDTSNKQPKKSDAGEEKASKQSSKSTSTKSNDDPSVFGYISEESAGKYNIEFIYDNLYTLNGIPFYKDPNGFHKVDTNSHYYKDLISRKEQAEAAVNDGYYATISLPEVAVTGTRGVTPTDRAYARAYSNQHLGESRGNSYRQTPLMTRLRNWWNAEEEPSVQETPVATQEYYFAPIPNAQPVVPQHSKAYERQFRTQHVGEKGQTRREEKKDSKKDGNLLDFVWRVLNLSSAPSYKKGGILKTMNNKFTTSGWGNRPSPYYAQGGVLKAQQGAPIQTKNSNTPTLDAIMNNPQLAETFLAALSQQLGKEITLEDLATAAANPELGPQLEAIAQQMMKQQAKHGAKLNYIAKLRNRCPEGQELVYYAKGGRICSACMGKKLEQGGKPKYMKDFEARQAKKGCKLKK